MDIKIDNQTVIVFDLDDTLYNEIDYLKSAYIELAKELEPENWEKLFSILFSLYRNNQNVFQFVSEKYNVSKDILIERYRSHVPDIKPFDGVIERFRTIKNMEGKIAILTDGREITQNNKIKVLGLLPFVDHIVISEVIGSEKPHEQNFKSIETKFNLTNYYYIGDNLKKDFITPKILGWQTIALIDQGLNIHSNAYSHKSEEYQPHNYIFSFSQLNFH